MTPPPAAEACIPAALWDPVPPAVRHAPVMQQGGFLVFEGLVSPTARQALLDEALAQAHYRYRSDIPHSQADEVRGGMPARQFASAPGGSVQAELYHATWMADFLRSTCGTHARPTGGLGTYSYYEQTGDYLALHRDIETCDVSVITCVHDEPGPTGTGGALCLYPERIREPISAIRASPDEGALRVRLLPGQTLVMLGGLVPHALLPVHPSQLRIVSVLCYRLE